MTPRRTVGDDYAEPTRWEIALALIVLATDAIVFVAQHLARRRRPPATLPAREDQQPDVDDFDPRSHPLDPLLRELHAALLADLRCRLDLDTQYLDLQRAVTDAGSAEAPGAEAPR